MNSWVQLLISGAGLDEVCTGGAWHWTESFLVNGTHYHVLVIRVTIDEDGEQVAHHNTCRTSAPECVCVTEFRHLQAMDPDEGPFQIFNIEGWEGRYVSVLSPNISVAELKMDLMLKDIIAGTHE